MKKLVLFAAAFFLLMIVALFLNNSSVVSTASPQAQARSSASISNSNSQLSPRSVATVAAAPTTSEHAGIPSTEDSALGYLQSSSTQAWTIKRGDFSPTIRTLSQGSLLNKTAASPREAADAFVKFYVKGLFGVEPERVKFNREEVTDRTRLIYDQIVDGVPVYGGRLSLFFENGALTRVQNDLALGDIEESSKAIAVQPAFEAYKSQTQKDAGLVANKSNRTVLYPTGNSLIYVSEFVSMEDKKSFHVVYDPNNQFVIQRRPSAIQ